MDLILIYLDYDYAFMKCRLIAQNNVCQIFNKTSKKNNLEALLVKNLHIFVAMRCNVEICDLTGVF